MNKKTAKTLN